MMVVGIHAFVEAPSGSTTAFIESVISHGLFTGAVPIFLFTSGYLFYRNVDSVNKCFEKQKKRLVSVVMPFFLWSALYYIFFATANKAFGVAMVSPVDISVAGIIEGVLSYKYCFPLWFMWQLILYIITSPLIYLILKNGKLSAFLLAVVAIAGICDVHTIGPDIFEGRLNFAVSYFSYYFFGCIMAKKPQIFKKIKEFAVKTLVAILTTAYVAFGILGGMIYDGYIPAFNNRCLVPLIAISLWAFLYKICQKYKNIKIPENVSTMLVYTIHPFVGLLVGKLLGILPLPKIGYYFLWFLITATLSCVAVLIIRRIKPIYRLLSGNR